MVCDQGSPRPSRSSCARPAEGPRAPDRTGGNETGEPAAEEADRPKRRWEVVDTIVTEGLPVQVACRVLEVSVNGYYCWKKRRPSARAVRHAMLADVIAEVHDASRQTYGARRVHAELVLGRGLPVARCTVELVMHRHGLAGLPGRAEYRRIPNQPSACESAG